MARSLSSEQDQIFNVIAGFFADVQTLELELGRVPRKEAGMMVLTEMSFEDKSVEIYDWVQDAVGDVAYEQCRQYEMYGEAWDEKSTEYIKKAKKAGSTDVSGSYADHLYNDPGMLQDLLGDRIHDGVTELGYSSRENRPKFEEAFNGLIDQLLKRANFPAWEKALGKLRYPKE